MEIRDGDLVLNVNSGEKRVVLLGRSDVKGVRLCRLSVAIEEMKARSLLLY